jgi:hypothetical protein
VYYHVFRHRVMQIGVFLFCELHNFLYDSQIKFKITLDKCHRCYRYRCSRNCSQTTRITFVFNRTRNEHFACLEQSAKFNFAAVTLTTAVSKSHFNIYLFITITTYLSLYLRCDLTKSGLGTVIIDFT